MSAPVTPLGDRVLVVVIPKERVSAGGVVLPDNVREESDRGVVIALGPGAADPVVGGVRPIGDPNPVEVGDVVVFSPYAGSKISVAQDDFLLLREHDLLGVMDDVEVPESITERFLAVA